MSFTDQQGRRRPTSVVAVVLVHAVIGYALISGLAIRVIPRGPDITRAYNVTDPPPPPPHDMPPAQATSQPKATLTPPDTIVRVQTADIPTLLVSPHIDVPTAAGGGAMPSPSLVERPDLARSPVAIGSRAAWVTEADYPPAALRAGIEGTVGIAVRVGPDGRVGACEVTASSGNASLDEATCRVYARRARFQSALDDSGKPTSATHADRVRWQVPKD